MAFGLFRKRKPGKPAGKPAKRKTARKPRRPRKKAKTSRKKISAIARKKQTGVLGAEVVGTITHYFPKVKAGVVKVSKGEINVGDALYIKGHTSDFKQKVASMQIDRVPIKRAKKGDEIGLLVKKRVRIGDSVYKL